MHINFVTRKQLKLDLDTLTGHIKDFRLNNLLMMVMVGGAIFLMVLIGIIQKIRLDHYHSKKLRIERSITNLRSELSQKGVAEAQLVGKTSLLKNYERRKDWAAILKKVTDRITSGLWIQSIEAGSQKGGDNTVVVSGLASTQNSVARFMESLSEAAELGNIKLVSSTTPAKNKSGKINFSIQLKVK